MNLPMRSVIGSRDRGLVSVVANRLRELRERAGLTLEDVAAAARTSHENVSKLERGQRRLTDDWMYRIAPALGVEPWELLSKWIPEPAREAVDGIAEFLNWVIADKVTTNELIRLASVRKSIDQGKPLGMEGYKVALDLIRSQDNKGG